MANDYNVGSQSAVEKAYQTIRSLHRDESQEGDAYWQDVLDRLARIHANIGRGVDPTKHKPMQKTLPKLGVDTPPPPPNGKIHYTGRIADSPQIWGKNRRP